MASHELVCLPNGSFSVRDLLNGQSMHSYIGAWEEAKLVYIEQSSLRTLLIGSEGAENPPLVLFDVGLGIGANALAAIEVRQDFMQGQPARRLRVISFENDLGGLKLALEHIDQFTFLGRHEEKVRRLLHTGGWKSSDGAVDWILLEGDFKRRLADAPAAELIYYDFYSPSACPELWSIKAFECLRKHSPASTIYTYAAATPARAALLLAGYFVGYGLPTPTKGETSVASTRLNLVERPLGREWLEKWKRSARKTPYGWHRTETAGAELAACRQFRL